MVRLLVWFVASLLVASELEQPERNPVSGMTPGPSVSEQSQLLGLIQNLSQRVAGLEAKEARREQENTCNDRFALLARTVTYSGCNRNMLKGATESVETCQNGTMTMYNVSTTLQTGLFDLHIDVNNEAKDIYHFLCTYTKDEPHIATCTLTYEVPARKQGPALVTIHFKNVIPASPGSGLPDGACMAGSAVIIGNYFYDSEMMAAGVYSFYAPAGSRAIVSPVMV